MPRRRHRIARHTLDAATAASLLLALAVGGVWGWSYWRRDSVWHIDPLRRVWWDVGASRGHAWVDRSVDRLRYWKRDKPGWSFHSYPPSEVVPSDHALAGIVWHRYVEPFPSIANSWTIYVPLAYPLSLFAALPAWRAARWAARRRRPTPGLCARCRYDLTGNVSGVCPECGTKVGSTS